MDPEVNFSPAEVYVYIPTYAHSRASGGLCQAGRAAELPDEELKQLALRRKRRQALDADDDEEEEEDEARFILFRCIYIYIVSCIFLWSSFVFSLTRFT